jgi:RNA polymerase sigma-70 factor (ECF subfamily)
LTDRELVQKLLAGDEAAQYYFFNFYWKRLYKACAYILGHRDHEAEDLAQEALMVALRKLPEFEFRSTLYHWLYRICMYLCYERIRKRKRQVVQLEENMDNLPGPPQAEYNRRKQDDVDRKKMHQLVETQRGFLSEACRNLLHLRDEDDQSYASISEILKIPIGTVMSRLARCKEALKRLVIQAMEETSHV